MGYHFHTNISPSSELFSYSFRSVLVAFGYMGGRNRPLATAWQSNKALAPISDGAVPPVQQLNGYKISNPTVLARIEHVEWEQFNNDRADAVQRPGSVAERSPFSPSGADDYQVNFTALNYLPVWDKVITSRYPCLS